MVLMCYNIHYYSYTRMSSKQRKFQWSLSYNSECTNVVYSLFSLVKMLQFLLFNIFAVINFLISCNVLKLMVNQLPRQIDPRWSVGIPTLGCKQ